MIINEWGNLFVFFFFFSSYLREKKKKIAVKKHFLWFELLICFQEPVKSVVIYYQYKTPRGRKFYRKKALDS